VSARTEQLARAVAFRRQVAEDGPRLPCGLTLGVDGDRAIAAALSLTQRTVCNVRTEVAVAARAPVRSTRPMTNEQTAARTAEIVAAAPRGWRER